MFSRQGSMGFGPSRKGSARGNGLSWNFRHIVNLGRRRLFQAVNLEKGYGLIEIRSPKEVLIYE